MTAATGKPPEAEKKGKDKEKKDLPPCKVHFGICECYIDMYQVVVRRLPPTMAVEQFLDQVSPVPEHDNFRSVMVYHKAPLT